MKVKTKRKALALALTLGLLGSAFGEEYRYIVTPPEEVDNSASDTSDGASLDAAFCTSSWFQTVMPFDTLLWTVDVSAGIRLKSTEPTGFLFMFR